MMNDERTIKISEKAAEKTLLLYTIGTIVYIIIAMGMLFIFRETWFSNGLENIPWFISQLPGSLVQAGLVIAGIYAVFYVYYRGKYGGF